jgi:alpha-methylacyl-CoA racemase
MNKASPLSGLHTFLQGVRILDLSSYIPGPLASLMLADMGADVVKVERPSGDDMQNLGPRGRAGRPVFYHSLNGGKKIVRLDLKSEADRSAFFELVDEADVVIEGFRPDVTKRLGVDYPRLKKINHGLVYCSISGYGGSGPLASAAAHDGNYLATTGVLHRNGGADPLYFDPPIADGASSLFAMTAILGALYRRTQDGRGCHIDLGIADVVMPLQSMQIADFGENGTVPSRESYYLNGGAAFYRVYRTKDHRHVMLGAVEPKFWRTFCEAAGHPEWIDRQAEPMPQRDLIKEVTGLFAVLNLAECSGRFAIVDCCFSPVLDMEEAMESEQILQRGLVRKSAQGELQALFPAIVDGAAPMTREPIQICDRDSVAMVFKPRRVIATR